MLRGARRGSRGLQTPVLPEENQSLRVLQQLQMPNHMDASAVETKKATDNTMTMTRDRPAHLIIPLCPPSFSLKGANANTRTFS